MLENEVDKSLKKAREIREGPISNCFDPIRTVWPEFELRIEGECCGKVF